MGKIGASLGLTIDKFAAGAICPDQKRSSGSHRALAAALRSKRLAIRSSAPVCYCDDCQEGARQIEALSGARAAADADGGTACMLFRKDRVSCSSGEAHLKGYKIRPKSASNRIVATCCNSVMYLNFDDSRHWMSAYRNRFHGNLPPLQMRICTKFRSKTTPLLHDMPAFSSYPFRMVTKLAAAWIPMLLGVEQQPRSASGYGG